MRDGIWEIIGSEAMEETTNRSQSRRVQRRLLKQLDGYIAGDLLPVTRGLVEETVVECPLIVSEVEVRHA
jgi:hypothetical protein